VSFDLQSILMRLHDTLSNLGFNLDRDRNDIANLSTKLERLEKTKRYSLLLSEVFKSNDINNFKSLIVEVTFAYAFETVNRPLIYEVTQSNDHDSSVDFLRKTENGRKIYFKLRANQQRSQIKDGIESQLRLKNMYSFLLDGTGKREEIVRLQNNILSKTQDKNGKPIKFFVTEPGVYNIVVAETSGITSGMVDKSDCMLTAYGNPYMEEHEQRKIFGLFLKPEPHYPGHILTIAKHFSRFRKTIHAILFLVKHSNSGPLDLDLSYYLIPNTDLVSNSEAQFLDKEIMPALSPWLCCII